MNNMGLDVNRVAGDKQVIPSSIEGKKNGAGNETRTRDSYLGKVVLYQLSYARSKG